MIVKNVNPTKLLDELLAQNIVVISLTHDRQAGNVAENTWITFAEGTDMELVQQIIDAHDPTPLQPQPTQEEILKQELAKTNAMVLELTEFILGGM